MDVPPLATNPSMYAATLMWAFTVSNALRVLTYLPTILKLLKPGVTGECQSTLTWLLWTLSNATLTLQLLEVNQRQYNDVMLFSAINTAMCFICLVLVYRVQARARLCAVPSRQVQKPQQAQTNRFSNQ
jgi:TctA family transporter